MFNFLEHLRQLPVTDTVYGVGFPSSMSRFAKEFNTSMKELTKIIGAWNTKDSSLDGFHPNSQNVTQIIQSALHIIENVGSTRAIENSKNTAEARKTFPLQLLRIEHDGQSPNFWVRIISGLENAAHIGEKRPLKEEAATAFSKYAVEPTKGILTSRRRKTDHPKNSDTTKPSR